MDDERLGLLIEEISDEVEGQTGYWSFDVAFRQVVVITDRAAGRMRVMTPVVESEELPPQEERRLLLANFDRVLDARYAIARGYVWSAFIHPLSLLTEEQFVDAPAGGHHRCELRNHLRQHGPRVPGRPELSPSTPR